LGRRIVLVSVALTVVGIALLVISNPYLRFATGAAPTRFAGGFTGNFTSFSRNSTAFTSRISAARNAGITTSVESVVGLGLVAVGLILEVFSLFLVPRPVTQPAAQGKPEPEGQKSPKE
jgi:hypothetical protein